MLIQAFPRFCPPPDPDRGLVACNDCKAWFDPSKQPGRDPWRCPKCQAPAAFAMQPGFCGGCGQERNVIRHGYDVQRALCDCHLSPARRRELAEEERRKQAERQAKARLESDLRRQSVELDQERRDAAACLADPDVQDRAGGRNDCRERGKPYAFCRSCRVHTTMAGAGGAR